MTNKKRIPNSYWWLINCGFLGLGEFLAASVANCAGIWPSLLVLLVLVVLFGYGTALPGWPQLALAVIGVILFFHASVDTELRYRDSPWLRGKERSRRSASAAYPAELRSARRQLSRRVGLGLESRPELAALNRAILLGERTRLPRSVKEVFIASGTLHVFAISGLHVSAVAKVMIFMLSLLWLPRRWCGLVALPFLWGYVVLIGCPPSALRAALMSSFEAVAPIGWRRPDGLRSWALTFLLVHVVNPQAIVNVGSALSFVVMLAIILAGEQAKKFGKRWQGTLWVTLIAWAAGVPIAARVFGRITPGGMLANLVLLSAAKCTVYAGAVGVGLSWISKTLSAHLNNLSALFTEMMVLVSSVVARLPWANFEIDIWTLPMCALWYAILIGLLLAPSVLRHKITVLGSSRILGGAVRLARVCATLKCVTNWCSTRKLFIFARRRRL